MPRAVPPGIAARMASRQWEPVRLYEIEIDSNPANNKRYAEYDRDVTFDAKTYEKFAITHDQVTVTRDEELHQVNVHIGNVNQVWSQILINNNALRGRRVSCRLVAADLLSDPAEFVDLFSGVVRASSMDENMAVLQVASPFETIHNQFPKRTYSRVKCQHIFDKSSSPGVGVECGWASGLPGGGAGAFDLANFPDVDPSGETCDHTEGGPNGCRAHKNLQRIGLFPGVGIGKVYIVKS